MCFPKSLFCELLKEMSILTSTCKFIFQNAGDRLAKANCYSSFLHMNVFNRPCISKNVVLLFNFLMCFKIQLDSHVKGTYNAEKFNVRRLVLHTGLYLFTPICWRHF